MNIDVMQRWVEALRSGKYEQGKSRLRTKDNKFCCLGVLCDVLGLEWTTDFDDSYVLPDVGDHVVACVLPVKLPRMLGMRGDSATTCSYNNDDDCLTRDNDKGKTFAEIADIIEKHHTEF